jgi:DNA (cytosine-5)-methyltransferase 1
MYGNHNQRSIGSRGGCSAGRSACYRSSEFSNVTTFPSVKVAASPLSGLDESTASPPPRAPASRLLDLFCGEGGAGHGYSTAGFDVTGVDIRPQPRYPHTFVQDDALSYLRLHWREFDVIHASPPCRAHSAMRHVTQEAYFDFIPVLRGILLQLKKPYIIENVETAPLHDPVLLCGAMFGLRTYRHRLFETNMVVPRLIHPVHAFQTAPVGRSACVDEYLNLVGHFPDVELARRVMAMPWASRAGIADAVPPAYTRYLGKYAMQFVEAFR